MPSRSMKNPCTPYVGMPAARSAFPSVAPMTMIGTVITPGHIFDVMSVTDCTTSARNGDAGPGLGVPTSVTLTAVSATTFRSAA